MRNDLRRAAQRLVLALSACAALVACGSAEKNLTLAAAGAIGGGTFVPGAQIEQIYYLGVIDPIEQVPEAIYRLRVRGQASAMSNVKFASGWVPSWTVDALSRSAPGANGEKNAWLQQACTGAEGCFQPRGRRLVQFGPESFREVPADWRLVIVMGGDPSAFFQAIDQTLGRVAEVTLDQDNAQVRKAITSAALRLKADQAILKNVQVKTLEEALK